MSRLPDPQFPPQLDPRLTVGLTGSSLRRMTAVTRALRASGLDLRIVALGVGPEFTPANRNWCEGLDVDRRATLPWSGAGKEAFWAAIVKVHDEVSLDVLLAVDAPMVRRLIPLQPRLADLRIGTLLPSRGQLDASSRSHLGELARATELPIASASRVSTEAELVELGERLSYPFWVKGPRRGARCVQNHREACRTLERTPRAPGVPAVAQRNIPGQRFAIAALGDGRGGCIGSAALRHTELSTTPPGWLGVAVHDRALRTLAQKFMTATQWRGPVELSVIRDDDGNDHVIDIAARFPIWSVLAAMAGTHLALAAVYLAAGGPTPVLSPGEDGTMFVHLEDAFDEPLEPVFSSPPAVPERSDAA